MSQDVHSSSEHSMMSQDANSNSEHSMMIQHTHSSSEHSMMYQHANIMPSYPTNNLPSLNSDMPVVNNNIHTQSACHNYGMPALFANSMPPRKPENLPVHTYNKTPIQSAYLNHGMPDNFNFNFNMNTGPTYINQADQQNIPAQHAVQAQPTNCKPAQSLYEDIEDICSLTPLTVSIKTNRF